MIVSQWFLHFPYGTRESYNLINITKLSTVYLRWKNKKTKCFDELKHKEIAKRERKRGDQDEEISLLMQWNAWITNGTKNEKDIKERTCPKLLYIIVLLK